jgi:hypothetical protein
VRWTSNDGNDDVNVVANGINAGQWGYNNLQWYGLTYYHKFNDAWHISFETYNEHQNNVPNLLNPLVTNAAGTGFFNLGGTPFSPQYMPFNAPSLANCGNTAVLSCTASFQTFLLSQRQDNAARQPHLACRIRRRLPGPAHWHQDPLRRSRLWLAALVLAPDRNPARSLLLQVAGCTCIQRQRQSWDSAQQELRDYRRGRYDYSLLNRGNQLPGGRMDRRCRRNGAEQDKHAGE